MTECFGIRSSLTELYILAIFTKLPAMSSITCKQHFIDASSWCKKTSRTRLTTTNNTHCRMNNTRIPSLTFKQTNMNSNNYHKPTIQTKHLEDQNNQQNSHSKAACYLLLLFPIEKQTSPAALVFLRSIGCILAEMQTRKPLFPGSLGPGQKEEQEVVVGGLLKVFHDVFGG